MMLEMSGSVLPKVECMEPALAKRVKIAMSWSYFDSHGQELR